MKNKNDPFKKLKGPLKQLNLFTMEKKVLIDYLELEGYFDVKEIPGRGVCGIRKSLFTVDICCDMNYYGIQGDIYSFENSTTAVQAFYNWDGKEDPGEWLKVKGPAGDRSNPKFFKQF